MMNTKKTKSNPAVLCKRDFLLAGAVLGAALLCYVLLLPRGGATAAVVTQNGRELHRISLSGVSSPYELSVGGEYPALLLVEPDGIRVVSASCPDKLCVRTGTLTQSGQTSVCLPARLTVTLQGEDIPIDGYTG